MNDFSQQIELAHLNQRVVKCNSHDALQDTARVTRGAVTSRRAEISVTDIESEDMSSESMATEPKAICLMGGEVMTDGCGLLALVASEDSLGLFRRV